MLGCLCWSSKQRVRPDDKLQAPCPTAEGEGRLGGQLRGISCSYFANDFLREMKLSGHERSAPVYAVEADVIRKKGEKMTCPRDQRTGTAYVDAVGDEAAGKSEYMLSYSWAYPVGEITDTLCHFFGQADLRIFIWMCCLCINQHRVKEAQASGASVSFTEFKEAFGQRVAGVPHILAMMSPWSEPRYIRRVWCVFEFNMAMKEEKQLSVLMPPSEEESFRAALVNSGLQSVYDTLASLRIQDADASVDEDKVNILKTIDPDATDYNESSKIGALNASVRGRIQSWLVEAAAGWLQARIDEDPQNTELSVYNSVGGLLIDCVADYSRAEKILSTGLSSHSGHGEAAADSLRLLGRLAARRGDEEGAKQKYMMARGVVESLGSAHSVQYAQLNVDLFTATGNPDFLSQASELFESLNATTHEDYPRVLKHMGSVSLSSGNHSTAMDYYELSAAAYAQQKLEQSPGYADLYTNMGKAHNAAGHDKEALAAYETARRTYAVIGVTETPGYADLLVNIGMLQNQLGDSARALQAFSEAKEIYEAVGAQAQTVAELLAQVGHCHEQHGAFPEATETYEEAKRMFERCAEANHPVYEDVCQRLLDLQRMQQEHQEGRASRKSRFSGFSVFNPQPQPKWRGTMRIQPGPALPFLEKGKP